MVALAQPGLVPFQSVAYLRGFHELVLHTHAYHANAHDVHAIGLIWG